MSENTPINKDSNILSVAIRIFSNHDVSRHQDRLMNIARKWYEISQVMRRRHSMSYGN